MSSAAPTKIRIQDLEEETKNKLYQAASSGDTGTIASILQGKGLPVDQETISAVYSWHAGEQTIVESQHQEPTHEPLIAEKEPTQHHQASEHHGHELPVDMLSDEMQQHEKYQEILKPLQEEKAKTWPEKRQKIIDNWERHNGKKFDPDSNEGKEALNVADNPDSYKLKQVAEQKFRDDKRYKDVVRKLDKETLEGANKKSIYEDHVAKQFIHHADEITEIRTKRLEKKLGKRNLSAEERANIQQKIDGIRTQERENHIKAMIKDPRFAQKMAKYAQFDQTVKTQMEQIRFGKAKKLYKKQQKLQNANTSTPAVIPKDESYADQHNQPIQQNQPTKVTQPLSKQTQQLSTSATTKSTQKLTPASMSSLLGPSTLSAEQAKKNNRYWNNHNTKALIVRWIDRQKGGMKILHEDLRNRWANRKKNQKTTTPAAQMPKIGPRAKSQTNVKQLHPNPATDKQRRKILEAIPSLLAKSNVPEPLHQESYSPPQSVNEQSRESHPPSFPTINPRALLNLANRAQNLVKVVGFFASTWEIWLAILLILLLILFIAIIVAIINSINQSNKNGQNTIPIPGLTLTVDGPDAVPNGTTTVTYTITASYTGTDHIVLTNPIPDNTTFANTNTPSPTNNYTQTNNNTITWDLDQNKATTNGNTKNYSFTVIFQPTIKDFYINEVVTANDLTSNSSVPSGKGVPANTNTCGGQYTSDIQKNPRHQNFGDPTCNFTKNGLYSLLKQLDAKYADRWFFTIISRESGYDPNAYAPPSTGTPDAGGAWGLLQMGQGSTSRPADNGATDWQTQIPNGITINTNLNTTSGTCADGVFYNPMTWCYWSTAKQWWGQKL